MKIYKKGNYIYLVNASGDIKQDHANEVKITKTNVATETYSIYSDDLGVNYVTFAELTQENGTPYASISAWELWYAQNTGFNPASGGSGAGTVINTVSNFASLPDPTLATSEFYWVSSATGYRIIGTYKTNGLYYSNGTSWEYIDAPTTATQSEVNDGTLTDKYLTPSTFENATKLTNKVPYTGATTSVDLGAYNLTATQLIKLGGVSTEFLKADGSIDSNTYLTSADLPSSLDLFATTTVSDIATYYVLVKNIADIRYNSTAVDVPTGAITTTNQLIASLVTDANVLSGELGIFNFTTVGNIARISGTGEAEFYFRIYKRASNGTETFITQSSNTIPVTNGGYSEFSADALWNDGVFLSTDRIVVKYYANRLTNPTGSDPSYNFQFGGIAPVRSFAPVPTSVIPTIDTTTTLNITDSTDKRFVTDIEKTKLTNTTNTNSGDETVTTIKTKLGITTLSGTNTGDQDLSGKVDKITNKGLSTEDYTTAEKTKLSNQSGNNTGDETNATIKTKLGVASGSNDGYLSSADYTAFASATPLFIPDLTASSIAGGYYGNNGSATFSVLGNVSAAALSGTASAITQTNTSVINRTIRIQIPTSSTVGSKAGVRTASLRHSIGQGFSFSVGWCIQDASFVTGSKQFHGLLPISTLGTLNNLVDNSSLINFVGVGSDASDLNLQIFYNDATGTASKIDLGANFPANRTAGAVLDKFYVFDMYNASNSTSVKYRLTDRVTGNKAEGTLTTDLPDATILLGCQSIRTNGVTGLAQITQWSHLIGYYL